MNFRDELRAFFAGVPLEQRNADELRAMLSRIADNTDSADEEALTEYEQRAGEITDEINSRAQAAAPAAPAAPVLPEGQGPEKSKYVREALTYLSEHYNDPDISVSSVARSLGVSDGHLSHVFKKETSYTLSAYLTNYRMHKATELLRDCRVKVYEVAESVGYRDITYFSSAFKKSVGMSPSEYQKRCQ